MKLTDKRFWIWWAIIALMPVFMGVFAVLVMPPAFRISHSAALDLFLVWEIACLTGGWRSCPGFPVNSYEQITCMMNGQEFTVNPQEGSFLFIADWQTFSIPSDVVVVGIENMENFRIIRQQRQLFTQAFGSRRLLFVSRYPQSKDLISWLQKIPNRYVHFGDFDLAGINIFLTEFHAYLGARSSFLIPHDIEARLAMAQRRGTTHNICASIICGLTYNLCKP